MQDFEQSPPSKRPRLMNMNDDDDDGDDIESRLEFERLLDCDGTGVVRSITSDTSTWVKISLSPSSSSSSTSNGDLYYSIMLEVGEELMCFMDMIESNISKYYHYKHPLQGNIMVLSSKKIPIAFTSNKERIFPTIPFEGNVKVKLTITQLKKISEYEYEVSYDLEQIMFLDKCAW